MQIAYCPNCGKSTGHKRALGAGTVLGAVVTGGASLLAVPFYAKRCIICGLTVEQATPQQSNTNVTARDQGSRMAGVVGSRTHRRPVLPLLLDLARFRLHN
jgi:hypothetical protein